MLLDDPLSALDAHVGKEILNLIGGGLKQDATGGLLRLPVLRVLVTHANQYLAHADKMSQCMKGNRIYGHV